MVSRRRAFVLSVLACFVSVTSWRLSPTTRSITQPYKISGYKNEPVLTVVDPKSSSRIHLVGVSHGSESSARLVSEVISEINPKAVVVELCDDRWMSLSLEYDIVPRQNRTALEYFKAKKPELEARRAQGSLFESANSLGSFLGKQGPVGGVFLLLGIFVGAVQRLSRTAQSGDEFVTAMRMAEQANIPIVLGDAPQNDTLASIKKVFSPATIDPLEARQGAESLLFSAFGVLLPGRVPPAVAKVCVKNKPFHEHINSLRLWPLSITVCPACLLTCLL
jgi:hypothetical protein